MIFPDYTETGVVYHIVNLNDLPGIKKEGVRYDNKTTYRSRYQDFHGFMNSHRPSRIPCWVDRSRAVFASMNFNDGHRWHSHSMLLALRIDPERCWIANENKANILYEPFVLRSLEEFQKAEGFLANEGKRIAEEYWETSLSFKDNLMRRKDREQGYDAEVMIFHPVEPEDIEYIAIVSDHRMLTVEKWKEVFCGR